LRDLNLDKTARISLLGSKHAEVKWRQASKDVVVTLPVLGDGELPFDGPRVLRIEGGGS
jgi:hypothetical protein